MIGDWAGVDGDLGPHYPPGLYITGSVPCWDCGVSSRLRHQHVRWCIKYRGLPG